MKSVLTSIICLLSLNVFSQDTFDPTLFENDSIRKLEEVIVQADVIVGSKFKAKNKAGSSYFISSEELTTFNYGDINRVLRIVPGVNVVEEEGFGIRPSIGLRGTSPSRSAKITLMEDGVLIAPAPYSAPAAYYFPTISRMQSIEILKGGSQIQYGPFTTGGAINLVSTQIPTKFQGKAVASMGSFNTRNTYMNIGDNHKNFGYLVEYNNRNSEGFKKIDFSDKNTGFNGNDYVAKFRINTDTDAKVFQSLSVKFQTSKEDANETYLGLTQTDFDANPNRRYLASEADNIATENQQIMLTHLLIPSDKITIITKAYRNSFKRNWYKLNDVRLNGETFSIANILDNPVDNQIAYESLTGLVNTSDNVLRYRANNRRYYAEGIQSVANFKLNGEKLKHDLDFGIRYHKDSEDRFQWNDGYKIQDRKLIQTSAGVAGTQDNRIAASEAIASHILYNLHYKKWTFTPGVRYESITRTNTNYGTNDTERTGVNVEISENKTDVWIPGMGVLYHFTDDYVVFSSVHKGFSPPGANDAQKPESSVNSEAGFRFSKKGLQGEVIGFYNQFSNLLGADSNAAGGTGSGDLFNAGRATVFGVEFLASYNLLEKIVDSKFKLPVIFTYTFTDTELTSNFQSGVEAWGTISSGDEIPYISKHQASLQMGLEHEKFNVFLSGKFNGEFRTLAGQGEIPANELVKSNLIFDLSGKYFLSKNMSLMGNIMNLFDAEYAVSRVPAGLRPGMPFAVSAGIMAQF